jgi:anthranilate synthase/aminodeoxychorismate synthase-like glutamine amidotransferase
VEVLKTLASKTPILGVCLGHQAMAQAFGGKVVRAPQMMHGKMSAIRHDGSGVFKGLSDPFTATRYHSLMVEKRSLPQDFVVNATSEDGIVMGMRHKRWPLAGVQFHPESIMTTEGPRLLKNFLSDA